MKKIMNKLVKTAVLCVFVFSCADLNKQPNGVETDNTFFENEDQAKRAITSVYDVTAWYNTQEMDEWVFGDICSDDAEKGGEGPADAPAMEKMKRFNCDPNVPYTKDMWNETYEGIFRANQCIDNIPTINMDATLRAQYVGEAKFLRALYYFRLQRTFNGVPLVLHPLTRDQYCQKRASPAEVWAQMEQDLKDAAGVLPEKKAYSSSDLGRVSGYG